MYSPNPAPRYYRVTYTCPYCNLEWQHLVCEDMGYAEPIEDPICPECGHEGVTDELWYI